MIQSVPQAAVCADRPVDQGYYCTGGISLSEVVSFTLLKHLSDGRLGHAAVVSVASRRLNTGPPLTAEIWQQHGMPVTGKSPGMISRRETRTGRRTTNSVGTARGARGASIAPVGSARAAPVGSTRTATDVFEVVADGNADMLQEMIDFSGAKHLCELRSKKREDYGQNLLHCAVANGQLKTLEVLLRGKVFDPNQVDSVYTRSTPMMEAVKLGRLDLVESLLRAGGRLDIQDVNGDTVLHWAAREVSAAFLRQVLHLARKSGARTEELVAALQGSHDPMKSFEIQHACLRSMVQVGNNNGEMPADACTNDLARESIRRIASGEETPGVAPKKGKAADLPPRAHPSGAGGQTSSHASPKGTPGLRRPGSATEAGEAESGGGVAVRRRSLSSVVSPGPVPRGTEEGDPRGVASAGVNSTTVEKAGKGEHVKEQHGGSLGEEGLPVSKPSSLLRR